MAYDGFISYSHAADGHLAPALQQGLQRLAKPWNRRRALNVFRDETGLATNPHLWTAIEESLDDSGWFILLASPEAAASEWVAKEVEHWVATKPLARILPVVTDGTWSWDPARADLTDDSTAVPAALRGVFTEEPRHLDLRWARSETDLDLRNSRFRDAIADLAAPMHGVAKDELEGEDIRQHRRARRLARSAIAGLAGLLVVALIASGFAIVNARDAQQESDRATREATVAQVRGLAGQAVAQATTAPDRSLLLAVEGFHRAPSSVEGRSALLSVLERTAKVDHLVARAPEGEVISGVSSDGRVIAYSNSKGSVALIDAATKARLRTLRTEQHGEVAVFFSADGRSLATTSEDGTVRLWNSSRGTPRTPLLAGHDYPLREAAFSPDGRLLATQDSLGFGLLWNVSTGRVVTAMPKANVYLDASDLTFSADGRYLGFAGGPSTVLDTATLRPVFIAPIHGTSPDRTMTLSADGTTFALGNIPDQSVDLFDVAPGVGVRRSLKLGPNDTVAKLAFSPDESKLAAGLANGSVMVFDLTAADIPPVRVTGHAAEITQLVFTANDRLLSGARDRAILWNLRDAVPIATRQQVTEGAAAPLARLAIRPDGREMAVSDLNSRVWFLDPLRLRTLTDPVSVGDPSPFFRPELAYASDGAFLVIGTGWGDLVHLDAQTHQITRSIHIVPPSDLLTDQGLIDVAVSPDGRTVATVDARAVTLVDVKSWKVKRRIAVPNSLPSSVTFSPDGTWLVVADSNGRVFRQSARHRDRPTVMFRNAGGVGDARFSPDGRVLALSSTGGVTLVDVAHPRRSSSSITGYLLNFSGDGTMLATSLRSDWSLWDVRTQRQIGDPMVAHPLAATIVRGVGGLAFVPRSNALITAGSDGAVVRWNLDPDAWVRQACAAANRNLTRSEWRQYVGNEPWHKTCPAA